MYHIYFTLNLGTTEKIILKETSTQKLSGRRRKTVVKKDEYIYIPLLRTLETLLNNATIIQEVAKTISFVSCKIYTLCRLMVDIKKIIVDYLVTFVMEEILRIIHCLRRSPSLQIILCFDELELCNPLESDERNIKLV